MGTTPPDMTPAEFKLMKVLWSLKRATVAEVREKHNRMYGTELAYTTVMTLLGRMASKRAVSVDKSRQPFVYRAAFRRESVLRDRLRQFLDTVFDGKADSLVLHLVADESLSLEELRRIERVIEDGDEDSEDGEGGARVRRDDVRLDEIGEGER
ncbi:BlaI/MecI/CopY family transcriptional regulator [Haliangium ochraceum]|uniref:Transcriptional repressor, CopY family n=1 Tax=Haliangium ochraceum (strain DSM 14365 / JCM 11303 / SMP-2) TaxID=502025 RepID=D0LRH8_HALO1|nr:BlaI/MecI/CopY family transcriptional regulator [Haliangium ochraceum]ACY17206.1 transcriptional repressor, CopY family [Haliangium ochraceum DSM 14365]